MSVANFGIPWLSSKWSYGIQMNSLAFPDDLYLTGQYVNNQNQAAESFLIFATYQSCSCYCLVKCRCVIHSC